MNKMPDCSVAQSTVAVYCSDQPGPSEVACKLYMFPVYSVNFTVAGPTQE